MPALAQSLGLLRHVLRDDELLCQLLQGNEFCVGVRVRDIADAGQRDPSQTVRGVAQVRLDESPDVLETQRAAVIGAAEAAELGEAMGARITSAGAGELHLFKRRALLWGLERGNEYSWAVLNMAPRAGASDKLDANASEAWHGRGTFVVRVGPDRVGDRERHDAGISI